MKFRSYAQNFEDVILWRCLKHVENGFYIDIGAQHPIIDSVSQGFYERGWRGVHVEPNPEYYELLIANRPDEVAVNKAISTSPKSITFYQIKGTGLSTAVHEIAENHEKLGFSHSPIEVKTISLSKLLSTVDKEKQIHWLKIDVEGMEHDVLDSWEDHPARPWIICIESTAPLTQIDLSHLWHEKLTTRGYELSYEDGLNRFYVHQSKNEIRAIISMPPNVFDDFEISTTHHLGASTYQKLTASEERIEELKKQIRDKTHESAQQMARMNIKIFEIENSLQTISLANETLLTENIRLNNVAEVATSKYVEISRSTFWRLTYPLRWIVLQLRYLRQYGIRARLSVLARKLSGK